MEEPVSSPLEHVQRAALEIIGVARSALDVLEDLVSDPRALPAVVNQVGKLARSVVEGATTASPSSAPTERKAVEHITIR
jgi:hypothetical protein